MNNNSDYENQDQEFPEDLKGFHMDFGEFSCEDKFEYIETFLPRNFEL